MPAKSWMPLWLAMTCAVVACSAGMLLHAAAIILLDMQDVEYSLALDIWMDAIIALPVFWLLSYVRYNQLAHIERLPFLLLFVWSIPVLAVIRGVVRYDSLFFGCITILILAGCTEIGLNHLDKSKEPPEGL